MSGPKSTRGEIVPPRLSASLILLNKNNDVLMIQRTKDSRTFAGMHAFPGGNYDSLQDGPFLTSDPRMTALRETFEETGILLASQICYCTPLPSPSQLSRARRAIHSRTDATTFPSFLDKHGLSVTGTMDRLIPFTQWVTPLTPLNTANAKSKSRFWTWFYVAFLEEMDVLVAEDRKVEPLSGGDGNGNESTLSMSGVLKRIASASTSTPVPIPTHDDHVEIQSAYFQSPRGIIQAFDRGDIALMPPQYYLLSILADILDQHAAAEKQKGREDRKAMEYLRETVGRGSGFGGRVFNPRFGGKIVGEDGVERSVLMYEGDEEYEKGLSGGENGVSGERHGDASDGDAKKRRAKHRSLLTFIDGRPRTIRIERTIDVLGLDTNSNSNSVGSGHSSKL